MARLTAQMTKAAGLRITPKHSVLEGEIRRLIGGEVCSDCLLPVVRGTGRLIEGRCGTCSIAWEARFDDLRSPNTAA